MDERLAIDEIKARYAPDRVLIGEPETDDVQHLRAGKVLFHSPDHDEVYQKAIDLRLGHFAFRLLGEMPEDMAFVLYRALHPFGQGRSDARPRLLPGVLADD